MFGRRTIATLKTRNQRLAEQRDFHHGNAERAQGITRRIAAKFADTHTLGWHEAGRLAEQIEGHQNILTRHARLLRACAGYRAENTELRLQHRREIRGKDEQLRLMQALLSKQHQEEYEATVAGMTVSGLAAPFDETPVAAA